MNGYHLNCIDFRASGVPGTSTICILGYLKVVTAAVSFEIKSYSPSSPASLFALPKGAKITGKGRGWARRAGPGSAVTPGGGRARSRT